MCHRLSCDQPQPGSLFQRPREAEKRDPGNEVARKRSSVMDSLNIVLSIYLNSSTCKYLSLDNGVTMTSKRRENINLVSFICLSFLVISFSKQLLIKYLKRNDNLHLFRRLEQCSKKKIKCDGSIEYYAFHLFKL